MRTRVGGRLRPFPTSSSHPGFGPSGCVLVMVLHVHLNHRSGPSVPFFWLGNQDHYMALGRRLERGGLGGVHPVRTAALSRMLWVGGGSPMHSHPSIVSAFAPVEASHTIQNAGSALGVPSTLASSASAVLPPPPLVQRSASAVQSPGSFTPTNSCP